MLFRSRAPKWLSEFFDEQEISTTKDFLTDVPYLICVFGERGNPYWRESVWLAVGHIVLAATNEGLGTLTYTPAAGATGVATITLEAMDDGGTLNGGVDTSPSQMFTITVTAVNDPPSFTAGANESVLEDSGAQTVVGWATAISPGRKT